MNALTAFNVVVLSIVIARTTANGLTNIKHFNDEYNDVTDELRWQLKNTQKQLDTHRDEMQQQLDGHRDEMQHQIEAQQEEMRQQRQDQKHELVNLVHTLLMRREDDTLERKIHNVSKRAIPSKKQRSTFEDILTLMSQFGVTGPPGKNGRDGQDGIDGAQGPPGVDGPKGVPGVTGPPGKNGRDGQDGIVGAHGSPGVDGPKGVPGLTGPPGKDGGDGLDGRDGAHGSPGVDGPKGVPAVTGPPGKDGEDGLDGATGPPGKDGEVGREGRDGTQGSPGVDGPKGIPGNRGAVGPQGQQGFPGSDNTSEINVGAVYTRWGRTNCPSHSTLVYEGFASGTGYNNQGGGANYQCLPLDPEYNKYSGEDKNWYGSWMAGAEFASFDYGVFPGSFDDQNIPCARCYAKKRAAVMMIPAKRTCPDDWIKEYEGYLMTELWNHHRATFECVDGDPEYINGLSANNNGALFYFVKTDCSGVYTTGHCPPYIYNRGLTCVVCTK